MRGSPLRAAGAIDLLDYPTKLAHVNYCDDDELDLLSRGNASVVYCPRTHRYFGHPPHRWREMLAAGVKVPGGADSSASPAHLKPLHELRHPHAIAPHRAGAAIWAVATSGAAEAAGGERGDGAL